MRPNKLGTESHFPRVENGPLSQFPSMQIDSLSCWLLVVGHRDSVTELLVKSLMQTDYIQFGLCDLFPDLREP
jgi:hypothetical protein